MQRFSSPVDRRRFLNTLSIASLATLAPAGVFAQKLMETAETTEGPFYPDKLPLDTDNDLLIVNDGITPAVGEITHLTGHVFTSSGLPVRNAFVEIWQTDADGSYVHSRSANNGKRDGNFQGFGRFLTGRDGGYYFRTIKPVAYPGRTPHIHFAIKSTGKDKFTTQCYIKGEPRNDRDGVIRGIRDAKQRESVIVDFSPIEKSKAGELAAKFDIVMGWTPEA